MSLLVTPEDLSRELAVSQPPLLIDLRPAENYCANHLPSAVHLDLFGISSVDTDPAPLKAFFWIIEHLLASRGVSNDVAVVVYDDTSGIRAARAFWFLEFFGHPNTRVRRNSRQLERCERSPRQRGRRHPRYAKRR
jgi:thiosulfate/3-mercaptopyruvate sulfurtransferase